MMFFPLKIRLFVEGDKSVINSLPEVGLHSSLLGPNVPISFNCFQGYVRWVRPFIIHILEKICCPFWIVLFCSSHFSFFFFPFLFCVVTQEFCCLSTSIISRSKCIFRSYGSLVCSTLLTYPSLTEADLLLFMGQVGIVL